MYFTFNLRTEFTVSGILSYVSFGKWCCKKVMVILPSGYELWSNLGQLGASS